MLLGVMTSSQARWAVIGELGLDVALGLSTVYGVRSDGGIATGGVALRIGGG